MKDKEVLSSNKDKGDIKFSIIIPAHNEEKYIEKCLQSIAESLKII